MPDTLNTRYPGARPFKDNPLERKLFFGRSEEQKQLLHLILSNNIVVLFAKSGVGKSSLLKAGVFEPLSKREYFPVSIRLNTPTVKIIDSIESHLEEAAKEKEGTEFITGEHKNSLREFLKSSEFWSKDDTLMTPVLVFDQFEEIFTLDYTEAQRKNFFKELAELSKVKRKSTLNEKDETKEYYVDSPPKVKIVLSLREEFLAQLEEISVDIPSILRHRFRLSALTEKQAIDAIERPAEIEHEDLSSRKFNYSPNAIKVITNFLMKKDLRERLKVMTRTWDTKWPRWLLMLFSTLLVPLTLMMNYFENSDSSGDILFLALWFIFPVFFFVLTIFKPIPGRNTVVPITLVYVWFFLLVFYTTNLNSEFSLLILFLSSAVFTIPIVLFTSYNYINGRNKKLNQSGNESITGDLKPKLWPKKHLKYLFILILLGNIIALLMDELISLIFIGFVIIIIYLIWLSLSYPLPTKRHRILVVVGANLFNSLLFLLYSVEILNVMFLLVFFIISVTLTFIFVAPLWWSYYRGFKSVNQNQLKKLSNSIEKIEPFQLQLICQNIENRVLSKQNKNDKSKLTITERDFGGDAGMQRILLKFYDDQLNRVSWWNKRKVRKLCEKGLISLSGRRLSLEEDDIINRFKLKKEILSDLVEFRLLRAEKRLSSKYYEISHDTLLHPILTSAKKNINRNMSLKWIGYISGLLLILYGFNFYDSLINPSTKDLYVQMDKQLEAETQLHQTKIDTLTYNLKLLNRRENWNGFLKSINRDTSYQHRNNKEFYISENEKLKMIDASLYKINEVKIIGNKGNKLTNIRYYNVSEYKEFQISPLESTSETRFHKLEIEWHHKSGYYSDGELKNKKEVNGKTKDTLSFSFDILESHTGGYNRLDIYELDPKDPTKRYLIKIYEF